MNLYLDTNVYCRPFDNQNQKRIREEAEAFRELLDMIESRRVNLITSDVLGFEMEDIVDIEKREKVKSYLNLGRLHIEEDEKLMRFAEEIKDGSSLKAMDTLHLASACMGKARYFGTCDGSILNKKDNCEKFLCEKGYEITIFNPIEIISQLRGRV